MYTTKQSSPSLFIIPLSTIICNTTYIFILFYLDASHNLSALFFSLIHIFIATLVQIWYFHLLIHKTRKEKTSVVNYLFVVVILYFVLSAPKYFIESLYPQFVSDPEVRFLGSMAIAAIILFSANINFQLADKKLHLWYKKFINKQNIPTTLVIIATFANALFLFYFLIYIGISPYLLGDLSQKAELISESDWIDTLFSALKGLTENTIYVLLGIYLAKTHDKCSIFLITINVLITFLHASLLGSRSAFLIPVLILIVIYTIFNRRMVKKMLYLTCFAPIFILFLSLLFFATSERIEIDKSNILKQFSYRFDFADYPITIMQERETVLFYCNGIISDALTMAVPRILAPEKIKIPIEGHYVQMAKKINPALPLRDYTDSYFSMGAQAFGLIGFLGAFPIFIIFLNLFEKLALSKLKCGGYLIFISLEFFLIPEYTWIHFLGNFRNLFLLNLPLSLTVWFVLSRKKPTQRV